MECGVEVWGGTGCYVMWCFFSRWIGVWVCVRVCVHDSIWVLDVRVRVCV